MSNTEPELVYAHFFFVDVVGLSNPSNSTKIQLKKLNTLHDCIKSCKTFQETPSDGFVAFPSGDGMSIGFFKGPHQPLNLAIELQEKLSNANKGRIPSEIVEVRIGLNSGNVFYIDGVFGERSIWGPGIIIARRVMDLGDSDHILMTGQMAEDLTELSDIYKNMFHKIEDLVVKHGKTIPVYSVYDGKFGNPKIPQKAKQQGIRKEFERSNDDALYPKIQNEITIIDPNKMLTHHKRIYKVTNNGEKPIQYVLQGIGTDVKKNSLEELKVKVYDEQGKEMEISYITMNYPYQKEFSTKFNSPLLKNESGRSYTLEYEVEEPERFFENFFQVECDEFVLKFNYPLDSLIKDPLLYEVNPETDEVSPSDVSSIVNEQKGMKSFTWIIRDVKKGRTIRVEW